MDYYTKYEDDNYHRKQKTSYIKIWLWGILLISILVIIVQLIYNYDVKGPKCKNLKASADYMYIKSITPAHPIPTSCNVPPPLFNFN